MNSETVPLVWMGLAFGVAAILALAVLTTLGFDTQSLGAALRVTARWSFLLFWLAYAGGPSAALFGQSFVPLARSGRTLGLAFAAAHLVHVGLVVWLYRISAKPPLSDSLFAFFALGLVCIYTLAILSFGGLSQALGPRWWRRVRFVAMNYILLAFARDFVPAGIHSASLAKGYAHFVAYAPFAALSIAAPLLAIAAAARRRQPERHAVA
ncbi:MAG TPA: hypothetical protein VGM32_12575 [Rhodopila sp.]